MPSQVAALREQLADEIAEGCKEAMVKMGFIPSPVLMEKIQQEIYFSIRIG